MARKKKIWTLEQAESHQRRAVAAALNLQNDPTLADELEILAPEEYAERRGFQIINNPSIRRANEMPTTTLPEDLQPLTKPELGNELLDAEETLDNIWGETLVTDTEEYEAISDAQKVNALELALDNITDFCNGYDEERFPIEESDDENTDDDLD